MKLKYNTAERIQSFNQGRPAELLQLKYRKMRGEVFTFFRGSCHLFYQDWPADSFGLDQAPATWACGDLHLENFGSYKGHNRLVYFDINDFDEAALAPCTWDLSRFLTSVLVGAATLGVNRADSLVLCHRVLETYRATLKKGRPGTVERETSVGVVRDLLISLKDRSRRGFLDQRTERTKTGRKLRLDPRRARPLSATERLRLAEFMLRWRAGQTEPGFFKLLDATWRVAGTGSLGLERYSLLVEGRGSPDQNYILDLKIQPGSALQPYLKLAQPVWVNPAQRVVAVQERMQATSPALLTAVEIGDRAYVLRELQPTDDQVNLALCKGRMRRLSRMVDTMAGLLAWNQLRSSGRQGSATADALIDFADQTDWPKEIMEYAQAYAGQVAADYREFCAACDEKGNLHF